MLKGSPQKENNNGAYMEYLVEGTQDEGYNYTTGWRCHKVPELAWCLKMEEPPAGQEGMENYS